MGCFASAFGGEAVFVVSVPSLQKKRFDITKNNIVDIYIYIFLYFCKQLGLLFHIVSLLLFVSVCILKLKPH